MNPFSHRDTLLNWRGFMVGKKRKKVWQASPFLFTLDGVEG